MLPARCLFLFSLLACLALGLSGSLSTTVSPSQVHSPLLGSYKVTPYPGTKASGQLTLGDLTLPSAPNPLFASTSADLALDNALWGQPVVFDDHFHLHADQLIEVPLPENGGVSDDGRTITMHLRPDLRWSDNQPLQATDFRFWWRLNQDPQTGAILHSGYDQIESIETPDALTVVLHMKRPFGPYLFYLPLAAPEHAWGHLRPIDLQNIVSVYQAPQVTSGPYQIERFEPGKRYVLTPNHAYRSTLFHGPHLARIIYQAYPSAQALAKVVRQGLVTITQGYQEPDLSLLHSLPRQTQLISSLTASYAHLDLNLDQLLLQDPRVRQALQAAINICGLLRDALNDTTCQRRVNQAEPSPSLYFDAALPSAKYDPALARRLLVQSGWRADPTGILHKGSQALTLRLVTSSQDPVRLTVAQALARDLRAVGIQLTITTYDLNSFFGLYTRGGVLATGKFDLALFTYFNSAEPDETYGVFHSSQVPGEQQPGGSNYGRVHDVQLDQALEQGRSLVTFSARREAYQRFLARLNAQAYMLPLYCELNLLTVDAHLRNVFPNANPSLNTWNIADWWLSS